MLMPAVERDSLPEGAVKLLNALAELNAHETWVQRAEMAKILGKARLTAGDMAYLEMLDVIGFVETRQEDTNTPMGYKWVYRLREDS